MSIEITGPQQVGAMDTPTLVRVVSGSSVSWSETQGGNAQGTIVVGAPATFDQYVWIWSNGNESWVDVASVIDVDQVPGSVANISQAIAAAPAASGDMTGAIDTAAIAALLNDGYVVVFPPNSTYYINATLPLAGSNGWVMPRSTHFHWVGAAGGSVAATVPLTNSGQAAFTGQLEGGAIRYDYASLTSSTVVVYVAQPQPRRPVTTEIYSDQTTVGGSYPVVAGAVGYDFDGQSNPGPFRFDAMVELQAQTQVWVRCSHFIGVGGSGSYGQDGMVVDADSLNYGTPGKNVSILGFHAYSNTNSRVRLNQGFGVTILGGLNEPNGETAVDIYAASTFTGTALVVGSDRMANNALAHYGSGRIRILDTNAEYDAEFTGQVSGVPVTRRTIYSGVKLLGQINRFGGQSSSASTDVVVVAAGYVAPGPGGTVRVRFTGKAQTGGSASHYKLWQMATAFTVGSAPTGGTVLAPDLSLPASLSGDSPVLLDTNLPAQSGNSYYALSVASAAATAVVTYGILEVYGE